MEGDFGARAILATEGFKVQGQDDEENRNAGDRQTSPY
jgi:hypothetical protein